MIKTYKATTKLVTAIEYAPASRRTIEEYVRRDIHILGDAKGSLRAKIAAAEVDKEIMKGILSHGEDVLCKKCTSAHCCTQLILISQNEMEWIKEEFGTSTVNSERLAWQLANVPPDIESQLAYSKLDVEKRTCIFLDECKRCSIYSQRPLICRTHYVFGSGNNRDHK